MQGDELRQKIKEMMVDELMLEQAPSDISDTIPIFGGGGLGLDSVDALQLVVGLEKHFGLKIGNPDSAKAILENVESIAREIEKSA
ncbi:MAG: phosphopantetheine-binding protein [Luteolibacter sp.]|uniref:acyl carrier protein n=1 Tax=Luteolibacter sp. TaxID=1962973 RepID=UPI003263DD88